jgi:hypothetical protein
MIFENVVGTMPYLYCCLPYCKKKKITRGQPRELGSFWNEFVCAVQNWEDFKKTDIVCGKHYAQVNNTNKINMYLD